MNKNCIVTSEKSNCKKNFFYTCLLGLLLCVNLANTAYAITWFNGATLSPSSQSVCSGSTPQTLTATISTTSGISGTNYSFVSCQWQSCSTSGGTYSNISGATSLTYSPPSTLSATTYYKCQIKFTGSKNSTITATGSGTSSSPYVYTTSYATITINATSITTQPSDKSVCSGSSATFSVVASGSSLTYQWKYSTSATGTYTSISGATSSSYSVTASSSNNGYYYKCYVTGSCGSVTSSYAKLSIASAPTISTQPTEQSICSGSSVTFSVVASGSNLTYQWQQSSSSTGTYTNVSGGTSSSLTFTTSLSINGYYYKCVVTNSACATASVTSTAVKLTVNSATSITTQPSDKSVCSASNASFSVVASGSSLTYQWQYCTTATGTYSNISGATSSIYTVAGSSSNNGYYYKCVVSGSCSSVTSSYAKLTVTTSTSITTQPSDQTVCSGSTATFSVAASGTSLTYQWQYRTSDNGTFANISGATSSSYSVAGSSSNNGYAYGCVITGSCGSVSSNIVKLNVYSAPSITTQPSGQSVCDGSTATFSVVASGVGLTYQWQSSTSSTGTFTSISGATSSTYSFTASSANNNYYYRCLVTSSCGTSVTSSMGKLTVTGLASITTQPSDQTVCSGSNATFSVSVTGTSISYQWQYSTSASGTFSNITGANTYSYAVAASSSNNGYYYRCVVSSSCTTVNSNAAKLTLDNPGVDAVTPSNHTVCAGDNVTYTVTANASGYTYQWQKVHKTTNATTNITTGTSSTGNGSVLTFQTASGDDSYKYQCVVTNSTGCSTTSSAGTLTFNSSTLTITTQPKSQTIIEGSDATFSVVASGSGVIYYQWQKSTSSTGTFTNVGTGGANIDGVINSTLTFTTATADNGYYYRCQITGGTSSCGLYTTPQLLTVLPALKDTTTFSYSDLSSTVTRYYDVKDLCDLTYSLNAAKLFVQLDLGDDYTLGSAGSFNVSETVTITPIKTDGTAGSPQTKTLQLSSTSGLQVQQLAYIDLTSVFSDYDYFKIEFNALTSTGTVPTQARILAWFEEDNKVDVTSGDYVNASLITLNTPSQNGNRVTFSWSSACDVVNNYQIEILRIYNLDASNIGEEYVYNDQIDWSKALSLEVEDATSISLYMAEGYGYYAWRVRPIGTYYENGMADSRNWGVWSEHNLVDSDEINYNEDDDYLTIESLGDDYTDYNYYKNTSKNGLPDYIFYLSKNSNDDTKNWIYNRTFTEHNRIAESKSYATGLGQVKQTQRKLAEVDSVIMAAQEYDFTGRPAIQSMSAPVDQDDFGYYNNLMQDENGSLYDPTDFDSDERVNDAYYPAKTDGSTKNVPIWENPRSMKGPISTYYSDANPNVNIPSAGNYPFSRTVYDKLGRPKKVSLFGEEHRMGLYDETEIDGGYQRTIRTYYSAVNDTELMGALGNMTPADTSVYKIIRVDPDAVSTVEYKTLDGKTIATAMIDAGDNRMLDDIYTGDNWYTKIISTQTKLDEYSYIKEQEITFAVPDVEVHVDYWLDVESFSANCIDYCSTCDYDITIYAIREETKEVKINYTVTINPSEYAGECSGVDLDYTMDSYSFIISDPGNYLIGRKITVNNKKDGSEATHFRDFHEAEISALLDNEAEKFNALLELSDTSLDVDNLTDLYSFIEGLPSGSSSSCGESDAMISGGTITSFGTGMNKSIGAESSNDLWLVSTNKDDDGNVESYTIASSCLEVEIPKIDCDWNPCDALRVVRGDDSSPDSWEENLWNAYGDEYYDFESMLYSKWNTSLNDQFGSNMDSYLFKYMLDKDGNYKFTNLLTNDWDITITSNTSNGHIRINQSSTATDNPAITIGIKSSSTASTYDVLPEMTITPVYTESESYSNGSGATYTYYYTTPANFASYVATVLSPLLSSYGYEVSYVNMSTDESIVHIKANYDKQEAFLYQVSCTFYNPSSSWFSSGSEYGGYTGDLDNQMEIVNEDYPFGNGIINTMLNHMLHEEDEEGNPMYGDCYDMYFKWEDFVNNYDALYTSRGNSYMPGTDFLQALLEDMGGTIYAGFSNHEYGVTSLSGGKRYSSSTKEYGYGYLEYAYKSFPFDTIDMTQDELETYIDNDGYFVEEGYDDGASYTKDVKYDCASQYGLVIDVQPSSWSNPKDGDASQDSPWDESTCGEEAWWSASAVIADELNEDAECSVWKNFYGCLNSDFESVDSLFLGDETTYSGSTQISTSLLTALGTSILDSSYAFFEKRKMGLMNKVKASDGTISNGHSGKYADLIISNAKNKVTALTPQTNSSSQVTAVGSTTEISALKNLWMYDIDFSISTSSPAGYTHVAKQNYKKGDELAAWLNAAFASKLSSSASISSDEINAEIEKFNDEYGLGSGYFNSYKTSKLTATTTFNRSATMGAGAMEFKYYTSGTDSKKLKIINTSSSAQELITNLSTTNYITTNAFNFKFNTSSLNQKLVDIGTSLKALNFRECDPRNVTYIYNAIQDALTQAEDCRLEKSLDEYDEKCTLKKNIDDTFKLRYQIDYHHFTLFYYDVAGNLVQVVPPAGVDTTTKKTDAYGKAYYQPTRADVKNHTLVTKYAYNSLGQRVYEKTPDGGETQFWYNALGQLRFSQNAKQKVAGSYSYCKYDELGRIDEAGESTQTGYTTSVDDDNFPTSNCSNKTITVYTTEVSGLYYKTSADVLEQHYLQNRISYAYSDPSTSKSGDETYTYYSYDPHGNVEWMLQSIPGLGNKYIAYEYDLVSGKVIKVKYNEGKADQFFHRYTYDSDNRIEKVETARDNYIWETDATYEYYAYGPLKRVSIGEDKIQGLDYVYTINGWLKGINHQALSSTYDPGQDGGTASNSFAVDAFGMTLGYFEGDFKRKYGSTASPFNSEFSDASSTYYNTGVQQMDWYRSSDRSSSKINNNPTDNSTNYKSLYSGTITNWVYNTNIADGNFTNTTIEDRAQGFKYNYDELHRLTAAGFDYYSGSSFYKKTLSASAASAYKVYNSTYSYDYNGNLDTLVRYGTTSTTAFDNLIYSYNSGTNKLNYVNDKSGSTSSVSYDLEPQTSGNYTYNEIGELTYDRKEGISTIYWTPSHMVDSVCFTTGKRIAFEYDAMGHKTMQKVYTTATDATPDVTYYVTDAKGSVIAIYTDDDDASLFLKEFPLYAGGKIGEYKSSAGIDPTASLTSGTYTRTVGYKNYEILDHLGNVRVVVTDVKDPNTTEGGYTANVVSASDYFPYGMIMPGRDYNSSTYRYGYQGKERQDEMKTNGNSYDFGARILDPRIGRWLSMDPLTGKYPSESPFSAMQNSPINKIDPDGREARVFKKEDESGNVHYTLLVTMAVLQSGDIENGSATFEKFKQSLEENNGVRENVGSPIEKVYYSGDEIALAVKQELEENFTGSVTRADGKTISWSMRATVRSITDEEQKTYEEHLLIVSDTEPSFISSLVSRSAAGSAEIGGKSVWVKSSFIEEYADKHIAKQSSPLVGVSTLGHEMGHSLGLYHPHSELASIFSSKAYGCPQNESNPMSYCEKTESTRFTAEQIEEIYQHYKRGELNND